MSGRLLLPGFVWWPAWWLGALKPWGHRDRRFTAPRLLVIHCGSKRADLAGYLADPTEPEPEDPHADGAPILCHDGKWRRQVATHGAWDPRTNRLVQMVGLELEAWGTGTAPWNGMPVAQRVAVHVELPGPPTQDRRGVQTEELQRFARASAEAQPSITHWVRHSDLDHRKRDPGSGLDEGWAQGILLRG